MSSALPAPLRFRDASLTQEAAHMIHSRSRGQVIASRADDSDMHSLFAQLQGMVPTHCRLLPGICQSPLASNSWHEERQLADRA